MLKDKLTAEKNQPHVDGFKGCKINKYLTKYLASKKEKNVISNGLHKQNSRLSIYH